MRTHADAVLCETDRPHVMLESGGAGTSAGVFRHLQDASPGVPGRPRLIVAAHSRSGHGSFVRNSSLSSHHVDHVHTRSVVARMVSMTCIMHARNHVWVHMLHA